MPRKPTGNPTGRPPLPPGAARGKRVWFRATDEEQVRWAALAALRGCTLSELIRVLLEQERILVRAAQYEQEDRARTRGPNL